MLRETYFWLVANPAVMLGLAVAGMAALMRWPALERLARWWPTLAASVCAGMFLTAAVLYFTRAEFIDHVEPQIAAVSWLHHQGQPIYHAIDGRQVYAGGPYGAGTIRLVACAYALFGPDLIAAKLASAFALLIATAAMLATLRREEPAATGKGLAFFVALIALPYGAAFWLRADPALLAVAAVGTWAAGLGGRVAATAGAALSLGAICWLKVHGAFYLFPAFVLLAARFGGAAFLAAGVAGVGLGGLQLLPWTGHGEHFVALLRVYARNPFGPERILPMLQWALVFSAPVWAALLARGSLAAVRRDALLRAGLPALGLALVSTSVLAARPGLGYWHLLPFVPVIVLLALRCRRLLPPPARLGQAVLLGWWLTAAFLVWTRHDDVVVRLLANEAAAEAREIDAVRARHPGHAVLMGFGEELNRPSYRRTFQRAHLAVSGEPYPYDLVVMMDYQYLGLPPALACPPSLLPTRSPSLILVPAGEEPWAAGSVFGGPAVSAEFRAQFAGHYRLLQRGARYDVWGTAGGAPADQP